MPDLGVKWLFYRWDKTPKSWLRQTRVTLLAVGAFTKFLLGVANRVKIYNKEALYELLDNRPKNQPLITVSNHESCIDDPLMWGMLKWKHYKNVEGMRWVLGGNNIMFTNEVFNWFWSHGQVVPVVRGNGVYQKSVEHIVDQLNRGGWCHMFPEGKVNMEKEFMRLKWGVGRMIADSKVTPVVLPIWHKGMDKILPNYKPYIPRIFKNVTINIGNPMDFKEMVEKLKEANKSPMEMRKAITDRIQEEFQSLKAATEQLHFENFLQEGSKNVMETNGKSISVDSKAEANYKPES